MFVPSDTATLHGSLERDFRPLESAVYFLSEYFVFFLSFCLILSFSFHLSELNNNQHEFSAYHLHVIVPTKPEEKGERKKPVPSTLEENSTHAIKKKKNEQNTISVVRARDKNSRSHLRYACLYSPDREIKRQTFEKKKNNLRCFGPNTHDGPQRMWCEPIVDAIRA